MAELNVAAKQPLKKVKKRLNYSISHYIHFIGYELRVVFLILTSIYKWPPRTHQRHNLEENMIQTFDQILLCMIIDHGYLYQR